MIHSRRLRVFSAFSSRSSRVWMPGLPLPRMAVSSRSSFVWISRNSFLQMRSYWSVSLHMAFLI